MKITLQQGIERRLSFFYFLFSNHILSDFVFVSFSPRGFRSEGVFFVFGLIQTQTHDGLVNGGS